MFNNQYHIIARTPLGNESCLLEFKDGNCKIIINKGSAVCSSLIIKGNHFDSLFETEVPFPCQVQICGEIVESSISGKVRIEDYLEVEFDGEETDGKPIPGIC